MRSDEEVAFWLAVNARPADPLPRLILADWLDEHGRQYEAEALRWGTAQGMVTTGQQTLSGDKFYFQHRVHRNLHRASHFLGDVLAYRSSHAAAWQLLCAAWSLCRRAGVHPTGEYDERRKSSWKTIADITISFALAQMPDDKRWDEAEQRKAVSAAYPFGERRFHPYKVWLSEVKRRLGPTYRGRRVRTEQRGLFEVTS